MSDNTQPPPPGWYADPEGSSAPRWWDGRAWGPRQVEMEDPGDGYQSAFSEDLSQPPKQRSAMPGLVLGIVALLFFWTPSFSIIIALCGVFFSVRAYRDSKRFQKSPTTSFIAVALSSVAAVVAFLMIVSGTPESNSTEDGTPSDASSTGQEAESEFEPSEFSAVDERGYALIAKNPEAHVGEKLVVYGRVTQFDSNTGECAFRADTDAITHGYGWEYPHNSYITGVNDETCQLLAENVISDDLFKAWVEVDGVVEYSTMMGGSNSALALDIYQFEHMGTAE